jgi:hypothetical protein
MTHSDRPSPRPRRALSGGIVLFALLAILAGAMGACQAGTAPARTIDLATLNQSGVTGSVTFKPAGSRSEVSIAVEPAGHLDMPAHIHPGTCDDLTPQPKFPLENVRNGASVTVVPATVDELFAGGLAVNIHKSNDDLKSYTACVDIQ